MRFGRLGLCGILLGSGCGGGATLITPPPPGSVEFTLTFRPDTEDLATAQALGWQSGIPAADVTVRPVDSSAAPQTLRSSAQGTVVLTDLPPGDYVVEVQRWLSSVERAALPAGDSAVGFAALHGVRVPVGGGVEVVTVPASRRRSLVISEWAFNTPSSAALGAYQFGGFAELYNNGDSTVYLDGMALGRGMNWDYDYPNYPCTLGRPYFDDPAGVWSLGFEVFPGGGTDYPVRPGQTVVIATDAIDHRPLFPGTLDLSRADFEFEGSADVDNPSVPNLVNVGYYSDLLGHGLEFPPLGAVLFLAQPLDYEHLVLVDYPGTSNFLNPRIPADRLVDVVAIHTNYDGAGYSECEPTVNARFDRDAFRGRGPAGPTEAAYSVERRATPILVAGRVVLQHTRTGNADLFRGSRTPGAVPR
jgi:hypothetical protein